MGSPPGLEGLILFFKSLVQTQNSSHTLAEQFSVVLYHQVLQKNKKIHYTFCKTSWILLKILVEFPKALWNEGSALIEFNNKTPIDTAGAVSLTWTLFTFNCSFFQWYTSIVNVWLLTHSEMLDILTCCHKTSIWF